jgi:enoyl-[acyl-carrier protein] reductase I
MSGILEGKKALIFGVANDRSIAWAVARELHAQGAELAFTYAGEVLEKRVRPLAGGIGSSLVLPCDVTRDEEIEAVFDTVGREWGGLDILIHAIAYARKEDLSQPYVQTGREGFHTALDISSYSLVALTRHAAALMKGRGGAVVTLTYMGSEKVVPNYNVMGVAKAALEASVRYLAHDLGPDGIRVNAISAGPVKTLAASGIAGFRDMLHLVSERAPLRRNVDPAEIGRTAVYLVSDLGSGVTGETLHVDAGYNVMGM